MTAFVMMTGGIQWGTLYYDDINDLQGAGSAKLGSAALGGALYISNNDKVVAMVSFHYRYCNI
jgi:hypothetical protein